MELVNKKANKEVPAFKKLTLLEQVAVIDLLRKVCRRVGDHAVYDPGYDDATVQKAAIPNYLGGVTAISRVRQELIGTLRPATTTPANNVARLTALEAAYNLLRQDFDALRAALGESGHHY